MRILSLEIKNILSIEKAKINFPDSGLILIEGWNHDKDSANGAGKTAIFESLVWGIYNQFPRSSSINEFVRIGSKKSMVRVELLIGSKKVLIERHRPKKFFASIDSKELNEEELNQILPINYQQFILSQYSCQVNGSRFLDLNDTGRKNLILDLMRAEGFSASKSKIDLDIKNKSNEILILSNKIDLLKSKLELFNGEKNHDNKYIKQLDDLKHKKQEIFKKIQEIESIQDEKTDEYKDILIKLNNKIKDIAIIKGQIKVHRQNFNNLSIPDIDEEPDGACPCCDKELNFVDGNFMLHDRFSIKKKKEQIEKQYLANKKQLKEQIESLEKQTVKENKLIETFNNVKIKIQDIENKNNSRKNRLHELRLIERNQSHEIENLTNLINKNNDLDKKISIISKELQEKEHEFNNLNNQIEILKASSQILSPTGVPAYIMDSVVQQINDKIQDVIQLIWPDSFYELRTFKESKSGKVTTKMSDFLTIDGENRNIGSLSGGERRCLSIAVDFAITNVVSMYTGSDINPIILDEPFDHLDASNRSRVIELLKEMAINRCIMVIDHASEAKAMFDNSITVKKKSGITTVIQ